MNNFPLISVIIPTYNYCNFIERCVKSVMQQSYPNLECIVVNDGSTDNTVEILTNLQNMYSNLIVVNKDNGGLSAARNSGLRRAQGEYIAFLDADDYWLKNKIDNQIRIFKDLGVDVVYSNFIYECNGDRRSNVDEFSPSNIYTLIGRNDIWGSASSVMIKRQVYEVVQLFDCNLRSSEDHDYWFRCMINGFKFYFFEEHDVVLTIHDLGRLSDNKFNMFLADIALLRKQLLMLNTYQVNVNKQKLEDVLKIRLSKLRWLSDSADMREYRIMTYLLGLKLMGIKYIFNTLTLTNLFKDFLKFNISK